MRKIFSTLILIVVGIFSAIAQITLTATLGTTGPTSYTTLKEAFDAVNLGAHQGLITIQVTASTSEAASAVLNASGNGLASYTSITIYPTSSGLSISGNLAAPLIDFNSADFVTIDGRVDQTGTTPDLTIMNTSTSNVAATSTIRFIVDACDNTIKYCNLKGATTATTGGILYFAAGNLDQGSDRMIIEYNNFTGVDASNRPSYALYSYGTSGRNNSDNLIRYNNFYDVWSKTMSSASVFWDLYSSYNTVSYNNFYETSTADLFNGGTYYFIELGNSQNGSIINNNYLGGTAANCGGSALVKSNTSSCTFYGIYVKVGNSKATEIQGNTIQNIDWGNSSSNHFYGIYLNSGTVNVGTTTGNLIGKTDINGSINLANATSSSNFFGIYVDGATSVVKNNTIAGITASNTDPANSTHFAGIYKTGSGSFTCQYNTIGSSSISNSCYASSASAGNGQNVVGIEVRGTGANNVSGNTISNLTNGTTNSDPATLGYTRGIYIYDGTNTVSNNTISKLKISNADNSSTSTVSVGGIVVAQPTGATQNIYGNTVSDLSNTYATFVGYIIGIYIDANTNTYNIYNNFVTSLSVTASTGNMIGIKLRRGNGTFYNNVISVGENSASNVYGIFESGAAVTELSKWYFNTVYIKGTLASGTNKSYCLYSDVATNTRDIRNNIFMNARSTTGGANLHYAAYFNYAVSTNLTLDYNDYYVNGTGGIIGYYNATNKTASPIITGLDANSLNKNPYLVNAGTTTATDYKVNSSCFKGITIAGQTTDYAVTTRAAAPTMGAFEYVCTAPAATVANITSEIVDNTSIKITGWTDQDCADGYVVKINATNSFTAPANGSLPTANTAWANAGEQVVYAGLGKPTEILVSGLSGLSAYHFKVFAYNNCSGTATFETTGTVQSFYSISGNAGTKNVDMGTGVFSDASGNYSFFVPGGWSGTVTPYRSSATFSPTSISYTNVTSNQTAQNYTATGDPLVITGNTGVGGVTITAGAVTAVSDANGDYSITLETIFDGLFTPSKPGYAFYPNTIRYDIWDISTQNEPLNFLAGQAPVFSGNILYVTSNGAGNGSGSSWSNAYDGRSLNIAVINAPVNAQLWIAQGSYSPVKNRVKSTYFLGGYEPGFGVKMYGGFAGNETQLSQRNWTAYPTILNNDNNIPEIIFAYGLFFATTNIDTEVNGFTIQNSETGIGLNGSQMTIKNCIFTNNGTGISAERNSIISGCTFNNNKSFAINFLADFSGSQMYENVSNCVFSGNDGTPMGSSIYIRNHYQVTFTNCTFSANFAIDYGGPTSATILNDGECILKNCVMWNNRIDVDGGSTEIGTARTSILNNVTGTYTATNCLIQGITTGSDGNLDGITNAADANYPQFVTPVDLTLVTPPTTLGDYHIQQTSPLINAGTNTGAPSIDIETTLRDASVDIGAYEFQATISGNAGIAGATLSYTNGIAQTATADGSGNYSFKVAYLWNGTVTPSKTGYNFSPANRSYTNVATNQTAQDYTATGNFTWTGTASTDWNTFTNWNSNLVPSATDHAIIPGVGITNFPVVNEMPASPAVCNNLTINTGARLTIAAGKALTVNGNFASLADTTGLVVKSDVNGTGSIKVMGSVSAQASVQRFTNLDRWYLVSSPIGTQTIKDFIDKNEAIPVWSSNLDMYGMRDYATSTLSKWNDYFTTTYLTTNITQEMGVGKGYLVRTFTYPAEKPVTLKFQGDLNSQANIDVAVARSGNNGWNLIGNPYSSAIKIYDGTTAIEGTPDNFINANDAKFDDIAYGAYFWNDASMPKKFDVINKSFDNPDNPVVTYAQVGQGFFVRAKAEGSSVMSFTKAMQFHKGDEALKSGAAPFPKIELVATSGDKSVSTDIKFIEGATKGLDRGYDAAILKADPDFALYTKLVEPFDAEFQLQCLPPTGYDKLVIPVGIDAKSAGEIVFSVKTVQLDQDCKVILEDKLTNTFTDLSKGTYKTSVVANTSTSARFFLHTGDIISGLEDQVLPEKVTAYARGNKEIRVIGEVGEGAIAMLVNGLGQVVVTKKLESGNLNIIGLPNLSSGVYILNINDKGTPQTIKVMVRK